MPRFKRGIQQPPESRMRWVLDCPVKPGDDSQFETLICRCVLRDGPFQLCPANRQSAYSEIAAAFGETKISTSRICNENWPRADYTNRHRSRPFPNSVPIHTLGRESRRGSPHRLTSGWLGSCSGQLSEAHRAFREMLHSQRTQILASVSPSSAS